MIRSSPSVLHPWHIMVVDESRICRIVVRFQSMPCAARRLWSVGVGGRAAADDRRVVDVGDRLILGLASVMQRMNTSAMRPAYPVAND